ncbi:rhamnogalacturonan acetylesterase [Massilia sp. CFBP9012]|uniref:rhamnogalacturonan acetylesterase n=1 Tax=Massilia sp. CFBP9012 TaxID=3096531 RepID=UPI002A6B8764|nr:rhamnogalacturonan acetylesterase [Massilia sp. CFBP9012]MDY0973499.1 rhamnogalacturonan acetylesterase [Massilia sp. CFBP9012]
MTQLHAICLAAGALLAGQAHAAAPTQFVFGDAETPAGHTRVAPGTPYDAGRGYGFEDGGSYFSVRLPEGNYAVTVVLGDAMQPTATTVKSELRRLMLENVPAAAGQRVLRTFVANVRTARIAPVPGVAAGAVALKAPRETESEAWNWDERLTLEFNGDPAAVQRIEIAPASVPTIFLLGDSTVSDQPGEPYNSWGQMLPRFFGPTVAVSNHAQSGETYRDSLARRRIDKILSMMQPGDLLLMQFGHNDQKQIKDGRSGPFTTYKAEIKTHVDLARARGGLPVIVSPVERRAFDEAGRVKPSLTDYAEAARESARELGVPFIDLNAMSKTIYAALGVEGSKAAFASPAPGKLDNTHHNPYGSYLLAKAVALGMRETKLALSAHLVPDFRFDPAHPDPVAGFKVPPSPGRTQARPLGDDGQREVTTGASPGSAR